MPAVLDRPGAPPPADAFIEGTEQYECACVGFKTLNVMLMCLRCLDAYSEGLEHAGLPQARVQHEMERVAKRLAVLLKNDPLVASLPVATVLRVAEGGR